MKTPDNPIITTCKNIAALFTGHAIKDGSRTWLSAPNISDDFVAQLKKQWEEIRNTSIPKDFRSKNQKREALEDISFIVEGVEIFPKIYTRNDYKNALLHCFFFSEARRNFTTMCYLQQNNIPTTEPLVLLSGNRLNPQHETVIFTRKLKETDIYFYDFREKLKTFSQKERNSFFSLFGKKMAELHNLGIYTEDTDKNISVRPNGDTYELHFFDFDNFYPWRFPNPKRTKHAVLHSLFCNHYMANKEESLVFLEAYLSVRNAQELKATLLKEIDIRIKQGYL